MNLVRDRWIKAIDSDGIEKVMSLREIFERCDEVACVAGLFPDRVAINVLMIAIVQDAIGRISNAQRDTIRDVLKQKCLAYLDKYEEKFDLYGKARFGQMKGAAKIPANTKHADLSPYRLFGARSNFVCKLAHDDVVLTDAELATALLTVQGFQKTGLFKKEPIANWQCHPQPALISGLIYSANNPILSGNMVVLLEGACILNTLILNIITSEQLSTIKMGKPFWRAKLETGADYERYATTFFGKILPLPYALYLHEKPHAWISMTRNWNVSYHPLLHYILREPTKKDPRKTAPRPVERQQVWRQLGASLSEAKETNNPLSPLHHTRECPPPGIDRFFVTAGGVLMNKQKSVCEKIIESTFVLEKNFSEWMSTYRSCFIFADRVAVSSWVALTKYSLIRQGEKLEDVKSGKVEYNKDKDQEMTKLKTQAYWTKLGIYKSLLLRVLSKEKNIAEWKMVCTRIAKETFDEKTGLGNALSVTGYAIGREYLNRQIYRLLKDDKGIDKGASNEQ